jgi:hypothetical protein
LIFIQFLNGAAAFEEEVADVEESTISEGQPLSDPVTEGQLSGVIESFESLGKEAIW